MRTVDDAPGLWCMGEGELLYNYIRRKPVKDTPPVLPCCRNSRHLLKPIYRLTLHAFSFVIILLIFFDVNAVILRDTQM